MFLFACKTLTLWHDTADAAGPAVQRASEVIIMTSAGQYGYVCLFSVVSFTNYYLLLQLFLRSLCLHLM